MPMARQMDCWIRRMTRMIAACREFRFERLLDEAV